MSGETAVLLFATSVLIFAMGYYYNITKQERKHH